ncbi:MAG: hypothetical protein RLZZ527_307 [Actinomycetota bacterium]|jgi:3,4-dihydroxy 2-butanone 4-phosphate synthase/GTP cyclohydrolase II
MSKSLSDALTRFAKGEFVIVTDDADRENEGDLFLLASAATAEKLAFMIRYTSGVICVAMNEARSRELHLPLMVKQNQDTKRTAFTVTVDAKAGLTTGISAAERANTIRTLADSQATAEDFIRPGHIFPLIAHDGGLKARRGHTEAVVELCRRVGATEVGVISELVNEDGSMMRGTALLEFARLHDIPMITIEELTEELADSFAPDETQLRWAHLPRTGGLWEVATYTGQGGVEHVIMRNGNLDMTPILVRIHSECLTGDVLGSLRCDCGDQLTTSLQEIESVGSGLLIYLRDHEGRGIGLSEKLRAYQLQDQGLDTVDANLALGHAVDERDFLDAVEILKVLGISKVTLMTNNPKKVEALNLAGIQTTAKSIQSIPNQYNVAYLKAKQERLGHDLKGI